MAKGEPAARSYLLMNNRRIRGLVLFLLPPLLLGAMLLWAQNPPAPVNETKWHKGNLHTHSLWSDGDDYPEMIADWYKRS